uniref:KIB1-4 beta-propeller domain-containing protein n=1 Tax=Aegilops tauschii TaxID=37682 RepID=M8D2L1_AEGTA
MARSGRRRDGLRPSPRRLHKLAIRHRLPAGPRRRRPALPPAPLDDAAGGPRHPPRPHQARRARPLPEPRHGAFVRAKIPLFKNHCALDSVDGLLLLQRDEDTAVRLLHPFTGDIAELPPLSTLHTQLERNLDRLPEQDIWYYIRYGICAAASFSSGVCTVMLLFHRLRQLAFATSQDRQWTMASWAVPPCIEPFSFRGKLYLVCKQIGATQFLQIDPPPLQDEAGELGSRQPALPKLIATCPADILSYPAYLVECDSEILVVGHTDLSFSHILVYKLVDIMLGRFIPVTSIGDHALFIDERTLYVSSKALPTIMADSIVYRKIKSREFAQYHLRSGTWSQAVDECALRGYDPGPRSLIHHIITCLLRSVCQILGFHPEEGPISKQCLQQGNDYEATIARYKT